MTKSFSVNMSSSSMVVLVGVGARWVNLVGIRNLCVE
jgi:hypothetical protein